MIACSQLHWLGIRSGSEETGVTDINCTELVKQEYANCSFSAGSVEGAGVDTVYLKVERDGIEDVFLLLRPDEAAAIVWTLSGAIWKFLEPEA